MYTETSTKPNLNEAALPEAWPPIETNIAEVEKYETDLENKLKLLGWDDFDIFGVSMAFHEWVLNAMIHGNMGIARGEGETDEVWIERIRKAQKLSEVKSKHVFVDIKASVRNLEISIQDEGQNTPEFWLKEKISRTKEEELKWFSSRGNVMARAFTNSINFEKNKKGIKVTLIRNLDVPLPEIPQE